MVVYSSYFQILLAIEDQDKGSLVTFNGTFCYVFMPFRVKNASTTNQQLMNRVFQQQIGWNVEVCVDDILVKSK